MDKRDLTREKLAFFGAITASLSHELKNVLATINELSGLMQDMLQMARQGRALSQDRLEGLCGKITTQIGRGEALIGRLNRFSHTVDEQRREEDMGALVGAFVDLTRRIARLMQVKLEAEIPAEILAITVDPFALQLALFCALDMALAAARERREVWVGFASSVGPGCRVWVRSADAFAREIADADRMVLLETLASQLGAQVRWEVSEKGGGAVVLVLT